jgi:RNA-directed DNA polymerase
LDGLAEWTPEQGTPRGAVVSPLLSNIYLDPLDHLMAERGFEMVRYADDFVILCRGAEDAARALETVRHWTAAAGLTLHPTKTRVIDAGAESFDFPGYRFENGTRRPRPKSLDKFKDTVRAKTPRTSGDSLFTIIGALTPTLRGWLEYFKHSHKWTFPRLDGWIRMRLRSILRRRLGLKGCGRGADHHRWPNAFFADQGLYSLKRAHAFASQSSSR